MKSGKHTMAEIGELEFIRSIRRKMPGDGGEIIRSAGDDCLVTKSFENRMMLHTIDTFVDSVHFTPDYSSWYDIGHRCMAASVSDIAAMAGVPAYTLVSASMPPQMYFEDALELFDGLNTTAEQYGCPVSGGETTSTPGPLTVTVTVIGWVEPDRMIKRSGAKPGDGIYMTGCLGDAMAGFTALREKKDGYGTLKRKFLRPEARVDIARHLTESHRINAMIDLSDGLASDLAHICEESGVGAEIVTVNLPLSGEFRELMQKKEIEPVDFSISAGEDFELLFTSGDSTIPDTFLYGDCQITRIGTVTEPSETISLCFQDGTKKTLTVKGYEHFRS
ncbi:MAG: thiamine-phosphate kinase [Candidatus Latescibacteria bacterium]|nr:thiamine-phosphate kinase [Candidatus Latescibacterota bacterium]